MNNKDDEPAYNEVSDYMLHKHLQKHKIRENVPFKVQKKRPESLEDFYIQTNPRLSITKSFHRPKRENHQGNLDRYKKDFKGLVRQMEKYHPNDFEAQVQLHDAMNSGFKKPDTDFQGQPKNTEDPESKLKYSIFESIDEEMLVRYYKTYEGIMRASSFSGTITKYYKR